MVVMEYLAQILLDEPVSNSTEGGVDPWLLKSLSCTDRWKEWCTTGAVANSDPRGVFHNR
jgi:hypothetical protein